MIKSISRRLFALAMLGLALAAQGAWAGETRVFSQQDFDRLTQAGKPVVLHISATWCPTCKAQKPIIDGLMKDPAFRDVTLLTIDFDHEKPTLRAFKVVTQSTLIAFRGKQEVGRSVGDTTPAGLTALFRKTLR